MTIPYPEILDLRSVISVNWTERDTMLYALGLGAGDDPMDPEGLALVTEPNLKALPTMATILTMDASPVSELAINHQMMVHGEQSIRVHRPLPVHGAARAEARIISVQDKGAAKGAVLNVETLLRDAASGELLATLNAAGFARGDGGFGGPNDAGMLPHQMPSRAADMTLEFVTRPGQALLYRLSGDYNPLHSDPEFARVAGFPRPILHGLCTYGITCRAVMQAFAGQDPHGIVAHQVRFSAPVFPGESISVDLWRDDNVVSFEAKILARNVTVIKNGRSELQRNDV